MYVHNDSDMMNFTGFIATNKICREKFSGRGEENLLNSLHS